MPFNIIATVYMNKKRAQIICIDVKNIQMSQMTDVVNNDAKPLIYMWLLKSLIPNIILAKNVNCHKLKKKVSIIYNLTNNLIK